MTTTTLSYLIVEYEMEQTKARAKQAHFIPIEFLGWECLTIGALGWGQIQIADANVVNVNEGYSRKRWMLELCDVMLEFYPKEIEKIHGRIDYFSRVKTRLGKEIGSMNGATYKTKRHIKRFQPIRSIRCARSAPRLKRKSLFLGFARSIVY